MLGRKEQQSQDLLKYQEQQKIARQRRVQQHQDNANIWKSQMAWHEARKQELKNEFYDPELVWNVEGPTRKKTDAARLKQ